MFVEGIETAIPSLYLGPFIIVLPYKVMYLNILPVRIYMKPIIFRNYRAAEIFVLANRRGKTSMYCLKVQSPLLSDRAAATLHFKNSDDRSGALLPSHSHKLFIHMYMSCDRRRPALSSSSSPFC